jgi:hypothetical protein
MQWFAVALLHWIVQIVLPVSNKDQVAVCRVLVSCVVALSLIGMALSHGPEPRAKIHHDISGHYPRRSFGG